MYDLKISPKVKVLRPDKFKDCWISIEIEFPAFYISFIFIFRAPLPGSVDDNLGAVIVEVDKFDDSNSEGFEDIPRDRSAPDQAGFR